MDNISAKVKSQAQLTIVTGLLVLYFIFGGTAWLYAALVIGLVSIFVPFIGDKIVWLWFKLATVLGWINGRILLSIVFFLFLTPLAFLFRLMGNDPLKLSKDQESMFLERNHTYEKKDLENIW